MRTNKRASGIIIKGNEVLLVHRYRPERGEYYVFPGGGVESEETIEQALVREMEEELGIKVTEFNKLYDFVYQRIWGKGEKHDHYFLITGFKNEPEWISGNEGDKENKDNTFKTEWHKLSDVPDLPLLPEEMKEKIKELNVTLKTEEQK